MAINARETLESVRFLQGLWQDAMDPAGLDWDDTGNNRAFLAGRISATLNGASIYIEAKRRPDRYRTAAGLPLCEDMVHAPLPAGPGGQYGLPLLQSKSRGLVGPTSAARARLATRSPAVLKVPGARIRPSGAASI